MWGENAYIDRSPVFVLRGRLTTCSMADVLDATDNSEAMKQRT
jgi:hypothetical protein